MDSQGKLHRDIGESVNKGKSRTFLPSVVYGTFWKEIEDHFSRKQENACLRFSYFMGTIYLPK